MKVLLLDDNVEFCEVMKDLLVFINIRQIDCLNSYEEFIRHDLNVDAALLDLHLGRGKSGIDAFMWLQQKSFKGRIIFFTGLGTSKELEEHLNLPNVFLLEKPARLEEIERSLRGDSAH